MRTAGTFFPTHTLLQQPKPRPVPPPFPPTPRRWRGWWPLAVLAGCAAFPAVDFVAHQSAVRGLRALWCTAAGRGSIRTHEQ